MQCVCMYTCKVRQTIYHGEIPFSNAGTTVVSPTFTHESRQVFYFQTADMCAIVVRITTYCFVDLSTFVLQ
jgi:hypothetical protein